MAQTYIIGSDSIKSTLVGDGFVHIIAPSKGLKDPEIHDFLTSSLRDDMHCVILDASKDRATMLTMAKHIRLSLESFGTRALCPIIFLTELSPRAFMLPHSETDDVDVLQTEGIYISSLNELKTIIKYCKPLDVEHYHTGFLNRITVEPPSEYSGHSLANEWGARVMYRFTSGGNIEDHEYPELEKVKKSLYLKYIMASTTDIKTLMFQGMVVGSLSERHIRGNGKRILYIDDCAESGWKNTLKNLFTNAEFEYIDRSVMSFEDYTEDEQSKILNEDWDLYLLDLRLGGDKEESIYNTDDFSGMKVLRRIKEHNRGNQVIMFTASNKAWNFKSLLSPDAGANGYYIKESPALKLPEQFSLMNITTFITDVNKCFERAYLKEFYGLIKEIRAHIKTMRVQQFNPQYLRLFEEVLSQLEIAFNMADIADSPNMHKYAYIAAEQAFEIISAYLSDEKRSRTVGIHVGTEGLRNPAVPTGIDGYITHILSDAEIAKKKAVDEKKLQEDPNYEPYRQTGIPERLKSIYLQHLKQEDDGLLYIVHKIVSIRNSFIHPVGKKSQGKALSKYDLLENPDFNNDGLIFSSEDFYDIFMEMAKEKFLVLNNDMLNIKSTIVDHPVGVKLILSTFRRFYKCIKEVSLRRN